MAPKLHRNTDPVRNVLDVESKLYPGHPLVLPTDIICNALIKDVMDKKEDAKFTLEELVQGYIKEFKIPTSFPKVTVYKQMYEQLLIRDLAYIGEIDDCMDLGNIIWCRQDSSHAYQLYLNCK